MAVNREWHHRFQCRTCGKRKIWSKGLWLEKGKRVGGLETPFARKHEIAHFPFKAIIFTRNSLQRSEVCSQKCKCALGLRGQLSNAESKVLLSRGRSVVPSWPRHLSLDFQKISWAAEQGIYGLRWCFVIESFFPSLLANKSKYHYNNSHSEEHFPHCI